MSWVPQTGDIVVCVQKYFSIEELCNLVTEGGHYTVDEVIHDGRPIGFNDTCERFTLKGIDSSHLFIRYFRAEDFKLVQRDGTPSKPKIDPDEAWDRAMGIL